MKPLLISICLLFLSYGCGSDLNISGITRTDVRGHSMGGGDGEGDWCEEMGAAYPNPVISKSRYETTIQLHLLKAADVKMQIINKKRKVVRILVEERFFAWGMYNVSWDLRDNSGKRVDPGMYRVKLFLDDKFICKGDIQVIPP